MNTLGSNNTGQPPEDQPMRIATEADWQNLLHPKRLCDGTIYCPPHPEKRTNGVKHVSATVNSGVALGNESVRQIIPNS